MYVEKSQEYKNRVLNRQCAIKVSNKTHNINKYLEVKIRSNHAKPSYYYNIQLASRC